NGRGNAAVDGRWVRDVPAQPGAYYTFAAEYLGRDVETPSRSILARVVWLDAQGKEVGRPEYPGERPGATVGGGHAPAGAYQAPAKAARAGLELHLRWAPRGDVLWRGASFGESGPPAARKVRVAAIHHRPSSMKTTQQNLDQFVPLVDRAAREKADIVC